MNLETVYDISASQEKVWLIMFREAEEIFNKLIIGFDTPPASQTKLFEIFFSKYKF